MEINAVIQVRTGSTRFPSKIFMELNGKNTVLDYVIKQLKFSKKIKNIILSTTTQKQKIVHAQNLYYKEMVFRPIIKCQ